MKFLFTTTLLVVAFVQCAHAAGTDGDLDTKNDELGGLDDDGDDGLTLVSCEEESPGKFAISRKAVLMSNYVKNLIESDKTAVEIPVKKVSGPILNLIVEYLKHHDGKVQAEIAKPIRSVKMEKIVEDAWDATFINKQTKKMTFKIILAANYMDIPSLLHLGCAKIATLIKGKSPEEIKKILGDDEDGSDKKDSQNETGLKKSGMAPPAKKASPSPKSSTAPEDAPTMGTQAQDDEKCGFKKAKKGKDTGVESR